MLKLWYPTRKSFETPFIDIFIDFFKETTIDTFQFQEEPMNIKVGDVSTVTKAYNNQF
jgi:hypothetical protein